MKRRLAVGALLGLSLAAAATSGGQDGNPGILGDVNGDGLVTRADALAILESLIEPPPPTVRLQPNGDVNRDGKVDARDAMFVLLHLEGQATPGVAVGGRVVQVALTPSPLELDAGRSAQVAVQVVGTQDTRVRWSSSNPAVAVADAQGLVRAVGTGDAVLRATSLVDTLAYATLPVRVNRGAVMTVRVTPASLNLRAGETQSVSAEALDFEGNAFAAAEFEWSSSNEAIATVSAAGLVTARAPGAASIRASSGGIVGTAAVTVMHGVPASAQVTASAATMQAGGTVSFTVTLFDALGHRVTSGGAAVTAATTLGTLSAVTHLGDGSYGFTFSSTRAGNANVSVSVSGLPTPAPVAVQVLPGPISPAATTATAVPMYLGPGDSSTIRLTTFDAYGNALKTGGANISATANFGTLTAVTDQGDGSYTLRFSSFQAGEARLRFVVDGVPLSPPLQVYVLPGVPDAASSVVTASNMTPGAGELVTIVVAVYDSHGNPAGDGANVTASTSLGTLSAVTNQGDGRHTLTFSSAVPGTATINFTINGTPRPTPLLLQVVTGAAHPPSSTVTASNTSPQAGEVVAVTVRLFDSLGNAIPTGGAAVTANAVGGSVGAVTDVGDGSYTLQFSSTTAGPAQVQVTVAGTALSPLALTVLPGPPAQLTLLASASSVLVDTDVTLTATVRDAFGNTVAAGTAVTWTRAPAIGSLSAAAGTTNAGGQSQIVYTAGLGPVTVTATSGAASDGVAITGTNTAPSGGAPAFNAIGNALIPVAAPGVLATATDPDAGQTLQAVAATVATAQGGTVTIAANGSFTYLSAAGFTGNDSFSYDLTDGIATVPVTVAMNVPTRVVYVQHDAPPGGTGRTDAPFNTMAAAQAGSTAGERLLIRAGGAGTMAGGLNARAGEVVIGEGIDADLTETVNGVNVVLLPAGSPPRLTNSIGGVVSLANNVVLRGLRLVGTDVTGITYSDAGTINFTASEMEISVTGRAALAIFRVNANASFRELTSVNSTNYGVFLRFITGSISAASGSLTGSAVNAYSDVDSGVDFTYAGSVTYQGAGLSHNGITIGSRTGGTVTFAGDVDLVGRVYAYDWTGGTLRFTGPDKRFRFEPAGGDPLPRVVHFAPLAASALHFTGGGLEITGVGADALLVGEHGTVSITGANNSIIMPNISTTGVEILGTIAPAGVTLRQLFVGGVATGSTGVRLVGTGGPFAVTGHTTPGSGGTVGGHGAGTVAQGYGMDLQNAGPVTLQRMIFTNNGRASVRALDQAELTVENSFFSRVLYSATSSALTIEGSLGSVLFRNNAVNGPLAEGVHANPTSGSGTLTIENNVIALDAAAVAGVGIRLVHGGGSTANPTFVVSGNTIHSTVNDAISLLSGAAGQTTRATMENNAIGLAGVTRSGSVEGNGIHIQRTTGSDVRALVRGNTIRQVGHRAMVVQSGHGGGTVGDATGLNVTIQGNTFEEEVPRVGDGPNVRRTLQIGHTPVGQGWICALIGGNIASLRNSFEGLETATTGVDLELVTQPGPTRIFLPGLPAPDGDFDGSVKNYLVGNNIGLVTGGINVVGNSTLIPTGAPSCLLP